MKQCSELTGGQDVECLHVQVAGTCIYRCKPSANGSVCDVSVPYFHSSHRGAVLSGLSREPRQLRFTAVLASVSAPQMAHMRFGSTAFV